MTSMRRANGGSEWIVKPQPNSLARRRLFCFPAAGSSASAFNSWPAALPPDIEVCGIQLPGRQQRAAEDPMRRMPLAVHALAKSMESHLDLPYAIFGACLGAAVAWEFALRLRRMHGVEPIHFFVFGRRAPHMPSTYHPIHALPEDEFWMNVERIGAIPKPALENSELKPIIEPVLRADFELAETYQCSDSTPLSCPITAFSGSLDLLVSSAEINGWAAYTSSTFRLITLEGGHDLLDSSTIRLCTEISRGCSQEVEIPG